MSYTTALVKRLFFILFLLFFDLFSGIITKCYYYWRLNMSTWFKNVFCYKITDDSKVFGESEIEELIEEFKIQPLPAGKLETSGFGKVVDDHYFFPVNNQCFLFSYQTDKKDIPSKLVKDMLKEMNQEFIKLNGRGMTRNETISAKEEIIDKLLPKAFIKSSNILGYIDFKNKILVVDTASPNKYDLFSSKLRSMLLGLNTEAFVIDSNIYSVLSDWVLEESIRPVNEENALKLNESFRILDALVMKDWTLGGDTVINFSKVELSEDVKNHITNDGLNVDSLKVNWGEKVDMFLNSNFVISKVKVLDAAIAELNELYGEGGGDNEEELKLEYSRASYSIMVDYFSKIISDLTNLYSTR